MHPPVSGRELSRIVSKVFDYLVFLLDQGVVQQIGGEARDATEPTNLGMDISISYFGEGSNYTAPAPSMFVDTDYNPIGSQGMTI